MTSLTLTTFVSLDGVMQAPGGPSEDPSGGFEQGGWVVPYVDADMGDFISNTFMGAGGFVLGRRTYEIFAAYWPGVTDPDDPVATKLNTLPKYVASTTLKTAEWNNTNLLSGNVPEQVQELKKQHEGGELQIHGSGTLARSLMAHDLIDVFRLLVYPVVLGNGMRLFADDALPTAMKLTDSTTTGTGIAIHTYEWSGRPEYGSIGLPDEEAARDQ
ncbi:deaminase [Streptomyces abyssalis]|uniref:Deaminase n=1 Tax=Streptomyces abyssalis TaxID=933944 RepID=A0A1E7JNJ8_9ACTN|nr:dihydrofolate reductase family protein [Streptomyces abyssalis]OEU86759.1 deaminase [Streptomyces abyssalis]OEU86761.1 deaminase [Streptomyces abyssalis]OEU89851.1 deaminase [Streptomyces abyssalis]OEV08818.1 deaminase [Streptomyces nanshensis]